MSSESKKFGAEGGRTRAKRMSKTERSESARRASLARWKRHLPTVEHDGVLRVADLDFPCAVLSDGTRVLTETSFMRTLGMYRSGALSVRRSENQEGGAREPLYLAFRNLKPFVELHLGDVHEQSKAYLQKNGNEGTGILADMIPKICEVWIDANRAGILGPRQRIIAEKAEILHRGLARTGIIALVDEATGFQAHRAKDALAKILQAFVQKELRKWVRTFPAEYYEQLCRLRGVPYPPERMKLPQYFGVLTNNIVYDRLAPGVKDELKRLTPRTPSGRLKHQLFRRLTEEVGHPKLREHLASVVTLMKISADYQGFERLLNQALPKWNETLPLPLEG